MAEEKLDKLKSSIKKGVTTINVKTSAMLEKAKIKTHINTLTTEIGELKGLIGDKAYSLWKDNNFTTESVIELLTSIDQKEMEILDLQQNIIALEQSNKQILGSKDNKNITKGEEFICPSCKTTYESPKKFCRSCGAKMTE